VRNDAPNQVAAKPGRTALTGASVLLVAALMVASRAAAIDPAWAGVSRGAMPERAAVRQLSDTFARVVRDLVGGDQHKPAVQPESTWPSLAAGPVVGVAVREAGPERAAVRVPVRVALLNLPPPTL
jgi:hypothetical protein